MTVQWYVLSCIGPAELNFSDSGTDFWVPWLWALAIRAYTISARRTLVLWKSHHPCRNDMSHSYLVVILWRDNKTKVFENRWWRNQKKRDHGSACTLLPAQLLWYNLINTQNSKWLKKIQGRLSGLWLFLTSPRSMTRDRFLLMFRDLHVWHPLVWSTVSCQYPFWYIFKVVYFTFTSQSFIQLRECSYIRECDIFLSN